VAPSQGDLAIHVLNEHSPELRDFIEEQRTPKLPPAQVKDDG
jgi:hypothetical protein